MVVLEYLLNLPYTSCLLILVFEYRIVCTCIIQYLNVDWTMKNVCSIARHHANSAPLMKTFASFFSLSILPFCGPVYICKDLNIKNSLSSVPPGRFEIIPFGYLYANVLTLVWGRDSLPLRTCQGLAIWGYAISAFVIFHCIFIC